MGGFGWHVLPALLWLLSSIGLVWLLLFHPKLLGCQGADQADFNSLAEQNEQLSQQLKQAKDELSELTSKLSTAEAHTLKAKERLEEVKELLPLEVNGTCGAPAVLQDHGGFVYCGDKPLYVGKAKDSAACQIACAFNSSCEFYSSWTSGRRNHLCRITASCESLVSVKERKETVQIYRRMVASSSHRSYIQLLGMYDSGTNLLLATLVSNFPLCCQQAKRTDILPLQIPGQPHGQCLHFGTPEKHVNPLAMLDAMEGKAKQYWDPQLWDFHHRTEIVIVALVRDSLAQLQSWKKAPYGMERCTTHKRCGSKSAADCATTTAWLTEPCTFFDPQLLPGAGLAGGAFRNVPAVWNAYTLGYVRLQLESGYKQIFVTKFEDLVLTPAPSIQRISEALGMPIAFEEVVKADQAAKKHGKAKNRSIELRSLESRDFIKKYSARELVSACMRLNFTLAQRVGYTVPECNEFKAMAQPEDPILSLAAAQSSERASKLERFRRARPARNRTRKGITVLRPAKRP